MDDDVLDIEDGTADLDGDHEMAESSTSSTAVVHDTLVPPAPAVALPPAPSDNELRLGKRVLDLETERNGLNRELQDLRTRLLPHASNIPAPDRPQNHQQLITIPHELLPTLALLRAHIAELTRDNEALRYTFLGVKSNSELVQPVASSSRMTLDTPMTGLSMDIKGSPEPPIVIISEDVQESAMPQQGVDLGAVLLRVRELLRENEELGEMVLEAGRGGAAEWQHALEGEHRGGPLADLSAESRAVITSLDADLTQHASVVQTLRTELLAYKTQSGPLPPKGSGPIKDGDTASTSSRQTDHRGGNRQRDRDKQKEGRDDRGAGSRGSERKDDRGNRGQAESTGTKREDREDHRRSDGRKETEPARSGERQMPKGKELEKDRAKEKERMRDKEREKEKEVEKAKERDREREKAKEKAREKEKERERADDMPKEGIKRAGEVSIRGRASLSKEPKDGGGQVNGQGSARREEDRESKRRR